MDTYRFEYAVFLLNKDLELVRHSIDPLLRNLTDELLTKLMTERNLRALDMRHTLPNLKNLLLTLTDPDTLQNT